MPPNEYDFDELYPGRFLKAGELKGREVTLTLTSVNIEELEDEKGKKRRRGILGWAERPKELVLNRTNGECIKAMFGRKTAAWVGKRITLHPPMVDAFGKKDIAIRVLGSPDIPHDITFALRLPRKKQVSVTLKRTKAGAQPAAAPEPPSTSLPDPPLEEPPDDVRLPGEPPPPTDADAPQS